MYLFLWFYLGHPTANENALLIIGGQDEEVQDSVEVLTRDGVCQLVDGFPAFLPEGRRGHVVGEFTLQKIELKS